MFSCQTDLYPPVVDELIRSTSITRISDFWCQVAAANTVAEADNITQFTDLETMGWIVHTGPGAQGMLNPYYLVHLGIHNIPFKKELLKTRSAFQVRAWDFEAKDAALKELVTTALVLRVNHSPYPIPLQQLIHRICGKPAVGVFFPTGESPPSTATSDSMMVTLRKGSVTTVEALPCTWSGLKEKQQRTELRRAMNVAALKETTTSILRFSERFNAGTDICMIGDLENGKKVLFFFECRYHDSNSSTDHTEAMRNKAWNIVNDIDDYVEEVGIARICFVYCLTAPYPTPPTFTEWNTTSSSRRQTARSFKQRCDRLTKKGCDVSLHIVAEDEVGRGNEAWQLLCMQSLYHAIPDLCQL